MKNILLLVHDDAGEEARLQAALDLGRSLAGHITCLDVVQMPYLIGAEFMMANAEAVLFDEVREREAENRQRIQKRLQAEDVSWDWKDFTGEIPMVLKEESRLADIIVLNTAFVDNQSTDMHSILSEVVLRSGKPIVAMPEKARRLDVTGHAIVAWNGSTAVCETIRAVSPLLKLAEKVTVTQFGQIEGSPLSDAASYMSRYGIHPELELFSTGENDVGNTLLNLCRDRAPSYCVMGAYGHSRLRESLFGGVTRTMLAKSPVPLILGH